MSDAKTRLASSPYYEQFKEKIGSLRSLVKDLYKDGRLSARDLRVLVRRVILDAHGIVKTIDGINLDERQQVFIDICVAAWEDLGRPAKIIPDLALVPDWMEKGLEERVVDPMLGNLIELAAEIVYGFMPEG